MEKERRRHRVSVALLLLVIIALLLGWWRQASERDRLAHELEALGQRLTAVQRQLAASEGAAERSLLGAGERRRLQARGLEEPAHELLADLAERPELIPHDGVLGGTMRFLPAESWLLNERWVWAAYEDGHIRGSMLLEYRLDDGEIHWRVLRSALD